MTPEELEQALKSEIKAANEDGQRSAKREAYDRTTVIAFGLLFVLPALIIAFSLLFLMPLIARTLTPESSGATSLRSNAGDVAPPVK